MNELAARRQTLLTREEQLRAEKAQLQTEREEAAKAVAALQDRMAKIDARLDTIGNSLGWTDDAIRRTEVALKSMSR
jgi:primosomal protein N''